MIWTMAEDFGAVCHRDVDPEVTHVVAANVRTLTDPAPHTQGRRRVPPR